MTQQIRTTLLTGFCDLVNRLHHNPETLLTSSGINPHQVSRQAGYLPLSSVTTLLQKTAQQLDCADFGLRLAHSQGVAALSFLSPAVLQSLTLAEFLKVTVDLLGKPPHSLRLALQNKDDGACFSFLCLEDLQGLTPVGTPSAPEQCREFLMGVCLVAMQTLCGDHFHLEAVHLKTRQPLHGRYKDYFKAPVHFGSDSDRFVLNSNTLLLPIEKCSTDLRALFKAHIDDLLQQGETDLLGQVEQLIDYLMPLKRCSLQEVANQLGLHKRTLQRRLRNRGLVFEDVLDRIRRERAQYYLSGKQPPMSQISNMLGYREQSSFNRACARWFKTTPMRVRRRLLADAAARAVATE
ncbi:AraC family transcriptional regulator [Microbulbifer spongiae]|uniref:AraC family transcriptional regulator n=1 Tax=Microbulbifer spongiae TaxID=2944933 RepID=A0ABY9EBL5_9GAMM|nr:AraC family transcriptional regulator [Microbulbifer sp. MI-G]WKD50370.1 AraC family transcriptional regulator [Microbulbifer sp. MI-G]